MVDSPPLRKDQEAGQVLKLSSQQSVLSEVVNDNESFSISVTSLYGRLVFLVAQGPIACSQGISPILASFP